MGGVTSMIPAVLQGFGPSHQQQATHRGGSARFWVLFKVALQDEGGSDTEGSLLLSVKNM